MSKLVLGINDLMTTHPTLCLGLVNKKDGLLVSAGTKKKVGWVCPLGHTWEASVYNRASLGSGCPYCTGKKIFKGFNDLATTHPELAKELVDHKLGHTLGRGSGTQVAWRCVRDHRWNSTPKNRALLGSGCPYCTGKQVLRGFNDLDYTHPEISDQLVNQDIRYTHSYGSETVVDWICIKGHKYRSKIKSRTKGNTKGCPVCHGTLVVRGINDLKHVHPKLAMEVFDDKYSAQDLHSGSNVKVRWKCKSGHEWSAKVSDRVNKGYGCSRCSLSNSSKVEQELFLGLLEEFPEHSIINGRRLKVSWHGRSHFTPDILLEYGNTKIVIEYDGSYWHKDSTLRDTETTRFLLDHGYWVVRVRESTKHTKLTALQLSHPKLIQTFHEFGVQKSMETLTKTISEWINNILPYTSKEEYSNENP